MKGLHSLHKAPRSTTKKVRIGRGAGSGIGTYSGRGIKGQKARTGGKRGLTPRSMRHYLLRIPKVRGKGFGPQSDAYAIVSLGDLQARFNANEAVTPKTLAMKGLVMSRGAQVKILADGKLSKPLKVSVHAYSAKAKEAIEKAGGSAEISAPSPKSESAPAK